MSKYNYSEIKPAINSWAEEKKLWANPESQTVRGIYVGYFFPSGANWSFTVQVEILTQVDGTKYLCETVRRFGVLEGIMHYQLLDNLIGEK